MTKEEWYVILNMNCKYEICRRCPKSGLFKGSYEECEKWIKQKQKEEKKDEMKNRISMALKDPILQQGFEIICKNLAELKSRNAELKGMYAHSAREAETYKQFLESKEKENAELKADNDARKFAMAMSEKVEKQLREENTELKDRSCCIIEDLKALYFSPIVTKYDLKRQDEILERAEQFLKDSEVEK